MFNRRILAGVALIAALATLAPVPSSGADFVVYSIYKDLDLGNPGETPQKDFYVNMGSSNGLKSGAVLKVFRKQATYDLTNRKLYKDMTFPIATIKVIHVEPNAAVARLDKLVPQEQGPAVTPRAVMIGDLVRFSD